MTHMKAYRIWAVTLRYLHQSIGDVLMLIDFVYWPLTDIVIWGMLSLWIEQTGSPIPNIVVVIVSGFIFWQIVYQANMDITNNLMDEFWTQNLVNMFSSPLTIDEWIAAVMLLGTIRILFVVSICTFAAWLFYSFSVLSMGWILLPYGLALLLTGWSLGFCTASFIMYGGMRVNWATWALGTLMSPFIGIYYPINTLPSWGQTIAYFLPPTYVFEGMRQMVYTNTIRIDYVGTSIALSCAYLVLAITFFKYMFEKSRVRGLARIE